MTDVALRYSVGRTGACGEVRGAGPLQRLNACDSSRRLRRVRRSTAARTGTNKTEECEQDGTMTRTVSHRTAERSASTRTVTARVSR
ncbi:hypothetical protein F2P81_021233 [Scophthalmus maximus]|uniref:Uncharacterized protein n=1 Tax=Scophthalmus maximus TaxID=52904 RepID=A0A6A4RUT9_SCOMX|nr:hypothetical protein F2P81_021233 [Scophthalmus maximus]